MQLSSLFNYQGMTLEIVIWSLFIGIIIGAFAIWYSRRLLGVLVRALLASNANTSDSAKSFKELGIKSTLAYKIALRKNSMYRKIVHIADNGIIETADKAKSNINNMKFYIPEEVNFRADSMYNPKGATLLGAFVAIFAFFIMALLAFIVIPDLIDMVQSLISQFGA